MFLHLLKKPSIFLVFSMTCVAGAWGDFYDNPMESHKKYSNVALPVAIYKDIKKEDFRKLIATAFTASNFVLTSINETKEQGVLYKFSYATVFDGKLQNFNLVVTTNETLDAKNRCANCFLRRPLLADDSDFKSLTWMAQFELTSRIFPDIDSAYSKIQVNGQKYTDQKFGFDYKKQWDGDRSFSRFGNLYAGINPSNLKREVIQSYVDAGFVLVRDSSSDANARASELVFNFPTDAEKKEGVVYGVRFFNQFDANGACYPCEVSESYDPQQKLTATGIAGIPNRLTLESRFIAGRLAAFEQMKNATTRYLLPKAKFFIPPQPAPLGSPRVITPPVVT